MFELSPFKRRKDLVDNFFDRDLPRDMLRDFFGNEFLSGFAMDMKADIKETAKEYIVEAELPGIKKEQLLVEFKNNTLSITAQQNDELHEEKENYVRRERRQGSISRSFYVENVDHAAIKGDYKNGILKIILPKLKEESPQNFRIKID